MKKLFSLLLTITIIFGCLGVVFAEDVVFSEFEITSDGEITRYFGEEWVVIPEKVDGVPVNKIGEQAFFDLGITDVYLPESLSVIGKSAFEGSTLSAVDITRDEIDSQLKSELLTALQPAMFKISQNNIYYGAIPAYTMQLADELNELLSSKWRDRRGVEIVEFGVSSVNATEEDEARILEYQRSTAMGRDANMFRGHMGGATAQAMGTAAANPNGAMAGFMGMGMAGNMMGGMSGFMQGAETTQNTMVNQQIGGGAAPSQGGWTCSCGTQNTGKFCQNCGAQQPAPAQGWSCECGATNTGKFCANCGKPKPAGAPIYKCDKCGWEPADPSSMPKFCPECGDIFDENDAK